MGSFEDDDDRKDYSSRSNDSDADSLDFETQQVDSQCPDVDLEDAETEDFQSLKDTMIVEDSYLLDDAFETQFVNLDGETQVVDLDEVTQVLDDHDSMRNSPIESLKEFYTENVAVSTCEKANQTEAFCETQVLSQEDDCVKIDDVDSVGPGNTEENSPCRQDTSSGGFTSVRCASMRASGLAARGSARSLCTSSCEKSSVDQQTHNEDDGCPQTECLQDTEDPKNSNRCKIAPSAAVRKLFNDEKIDQFDIASSDNGNIDIASKNSLARLSYGDSQEPSDLSQVRALEVVDKFLDHNVMDFEERIGWTVKNVEKTRVSVPGVKGSRELAKMSSIVKNVEGEIGAYDWDDNREDDGGGDFFLKKKELLFDNPKSKGLTEPRVKAGARNSGGKREQKWSKNKLKGSPYSDSRLMSRKAVANGKTSINRRGKKEMMQKNLMKDLDLQVNMEPGPGLVENEKTKNFMDAKDDTVGPDTQMAAEAMETLCFEVQLPDDKAETTGKNQSAKKRKHQVTVGVVTRQAKQIKKTCNDSPLPSKNPSLIVSETRGAKSTGQRCRKKCHLEENLDFSVPVAHRTRKGVELSRSKEVAKPFDDGIKNKRSGGLTVSESCAMNNPQEKTPRKESLVQADPDYNTGRLKRSRKVGASSLGRQPEKIHLNKNASNCEKIVSKEAKAEGRTEPTSPPASCRIPSNAASPVCMGDEYHKQSCRKNLSRLSLISEIDNAVTESPGLFGGMTETRKRKDITSVRVLFSQHLSEDVVKQQKKILARLGGAVATLMSDATHFVANEFIRTRNMLEAIAFGKPVVTQLWLDSCGQASCLTDENNFILRDSKKEKEFGFCLPASLSRACQHPLLQGQKVLVTPNTKPGKVILANLIKDVHGLAIERIGRSILKDDKLPDDLLILSCEEDYDVCVPFLEKGGSIYSSELLLNGIVKQKLEYERHRLFEGRVKRTRSTMWMKKSNSYLPVPKRK